MQKTEHLARLLHLSATGKGFGILVSLMILLATSARAAEPILTLAMTRDPQPQGKSFVATYGDLMCGTNGSLSGFSLKNSSLATATLQNETTTAALPDVRLEKQINSSQHDSFQLVHENLTSSSLSNVSFSLQAGYGRIWDEKSMLQKISSDRQEPGCAYVRAAFSF